MRRVLLVVLASLAIALGAGAVWWGGRGEGLGADDPKLLANRVWAERAPRDDRDLVAYFVPLQLGSKRTGVTQRASKYAYAGELFTWTRSGTDLVVEIPQRRAKVTVPVRTWACGANEAPAGFDLCLELGKGDDKVRLYSRKGWRVPKGEALPVSDAGFDDLPDLGGACDACAPAGLEALLTGGPVARQ